MCVCVSIYIYILGVVKRNSLFLHEIEWKNNGFLFTTPNIYLDNFYIILLIIYIYIYMYFVFNNNHFHHFHQEVRCIYIYIYIHISLLAILVEKTYELKILKDNQGNDEDDYY